MEADWLRSRLESGRSIESIAREAGKAPSTVAYWVNKHGLMSHHAARHKPPRPDLAGRARVARRAGALDPRRSRAGSTGARRPSATGCASTGCETQPARYSLPRRAEADAVWSATCSRARRGHRSSARGGRALPLPALQWRGRVGRGGARSRRSWWPRRAARACSAATPATSARSSSITSTRRRRRSRSASGGLARSLDRARAEAAKCVLLCANCHAEVEADDRYYSSLRPCR